MSEIVDQFLDRMPSRMAGTFTGEQRAALYRALKAESWRNHPVNIRLSIPFFGKGFYLTLVAGREKRAKARLKRQKRIFPLHRLGNILFLLGLTGTGVLLTMVLLAFLRSFG